MAEKKETPVGVFDTPTGEASIVIENGMATIAIPVRGAKLAEKDDGILKVINIGFQGKGAKVDGLTLNHKGRPFVPYVVLSVYGRHGTAKAKDDSYEDFTVD